MRRHTTRGYLYVLTAALTVVLLGLARADDPVQGTQLDRLLSAAKSAAEAGDVDTARARLRAALEIDPDSRATRDAVRSLLTSRSTRLADPRQALRSHDVATRRAAVTALARLRGDPVVPLLTDTLVKDGDASVREAALAALRDHDAVPALLARTTGGTAKQRMRALDALGEIGGASAVHVLVARYEAHGGGAPRVHAALLTQRTYVQDFDVEVG